MPNKKHNLLGKRFERWLVISEMPPRGKVTVWKCRCQCGAISLVDAGRLTNGKSKSCGCLRSELLLSGHFSRITHGMYESATHKAWTNMKQRCGNQNHPQFPLYGGRGIKVCKKWMDFESFLSDMGERPDGLSLERIDNNRGYGPNNCKWASRSEQLSNRRITRKVKLNGRVVLVTEAAMQIGISARLIAKRLDKGWSDELATSTSKWVRVASTKNQAAEQSQKQSMQPIG